MLALGQKSSSFSKNIVPEYRDLRGGIRLFGRTCGDNASGLGKGGDIAGRRLKLVCQISIVLGDQEARLPVCCDVMCGFGKFRRHCKQVQ